MLSQIKLLDFDWLAIVAIFLDDVLNIVPMIIFFRKNFNDIYYIVPKHLRAGRYIVYHLAKLFVER